MYSLNEKKIDLKSLIKGLAFLSKSNIRKRLTSLYELSLYDTIMCYHSIKEDKAYEKELAYLKEKKHLSIFPYPSTKKLGKIEAKYDFRKNMNYILHKGKRLYFPSSYSKALSIETYKNFIENEDLLGEGYKSSSPHAYFSKDFCFEKDAIIFDLGCAEGLVSLDLAEKASKIILFESDKKWIKALKESFAPWKDKVIIINKLVSSKDSNTSITLETAFKKHIENAENSADLKNKKLFVKMDIEGYEQDVLESSKDWIVKHIDRLHIACCTYHKHNDAQDIAAFFKQVAQDSHKELSSQFSEGYLLAYKTDQILAPYFRKGLLRVKKTS